MPLTMWTDPRGQVIPTKYLSAVSKQAATARSWGVKDFSATANLKAL